MANVPRVPGVPNLSSYSAVPVEFLLADAVSLILQFLNGPQWGIFLDGEEVIFGDSVVSFEFRQDNPISDYPVEAGGFQSYDKVQLPAQIKMPYAAGGSIANRQAFLASIEENINTTDLYDIVTPEKIYLGYNFTHMDLRRTASNGVGLLLVDLWLMEVRETSTSTFTDTQQPGDAGKQSVGNVQPQTPSDSVSQQFSSGNWQVQ